MPEKVRSSGGIGVIGVNAVVLSSGVNDVVVTAAQNEQLVDIERLRIDLAIHRKASQLRKIDWLHISRCQYRFLQIRVRPLIAVICSQYIGFGCDHGATGKN